jgi:hypothetical protein
VLAKDRFSATANNSVLGVTVLFIVGDVSGRWCAKGFFM